MSLNYKWILVIITTVVLGLIALWMLMFPKRSEAIVLPQITICHTQSTPDVTLTISLNALAAHLAHGDSIGACVTPSPSPSPTSEPCEEEEEEYEYDEYGQWEPEPCPSPSVSPSVSPSLSPSPSPSGSPEPSGSPLPSEEPSPSPQESPTPSETPGNPGLTEAGAYVCPDTSPTRAPANFHIYRNGNLVQVKWLPDNPKDGDQAIIYWGIVGQGWQHSLLTANDGFEVINLYSVLDYSFAAQIVKGCGAGPMSQTVVDGNTSQWVLFR